MTLKAQSIKVSLAAALLLFAGIGFAGYKGEMVDYMTLFSMFTYAEAGSMAGRPTPKHASISPAARRVKIMTNQTVSSAGAAIALDIPEHDGAERTINYEINRVISRTVRTDHSTG